MSSEAPGCGRCVVHPSSVIGPNVVLGSGSVVGPNCHLEGRIQVGVGVRLTADINMVGDIRIGAGCVIEPGVRLSISPGRASVRKLPLTTLGDGVRLGPGVVLGSGVTIGANARVGADSVVLHDVPPWAIVAGNPAVAMGYVAGSDAPSPQNADGSWDCGVSGVRLHAFQPFRDSRGELSVGEFLQTVPFQPKRYFLVYNVPSVVARGGHAHKTCEQFLVCVHGAVSVLVDDGRSKAEITLVHPSLGVYMPRMIWGVQRNFSSDGVLLVFASHHYDTGDYINDYAAFLRLMEH